MDTKHKMDNTQITIEQESANSLIQRAMQSEKRSMAILLIGAACRLDSSISEDNIFSQWREMWLSNNKNRSK